MSNTQQPAAGETITGPLNILTPDNSYAPAIDGYGSAIAPVTPYVSYQTPMGATAGTPSNAQVMALCRALAPLVAQEIVRQSAMVSRVTLLPQQYPATGYSPLTNTYNYGAGFRGLGSPLPFGATANVQIVANTRAYYGEKVPVDLVLGNPTLTADLARRLACPLQGRIDSDLLALWSQFTINAVQGTAGSGNPLGGAAAALALLAITGEPVFLAVSQSQMGLTNHGVVGNGIVNEFFDPTGTTQNLANAASPAFPANGPGFWIITTPYVAQTGSGPATTHNQMFTPSAMAMVFEAETNINNTNTSPIANCIATGSYGNVTVTVWALNSGSGVQAIYASIAYGVAAGTNANGVQVKS